MEHLVLRSYIGLARYERYEPDGPYTLEMVKAEMQATVPVMLCWDEPEAIAKIIYQVWGYTASQQFAKGIIEQPGRTANLLICSQLRDAYGDLSKVTGFDKQGNFIRERHNDILMPVMQGKRIISLKGYASRMLLKEIKQAA
jgi:hypothetical protein